MSVRIPNNQSNFKLYYKDGNNKITKVYDDAKLSKLKEITLTTYNSNNKATKSMKYLVENNFTKKLVRIDIYDSSNKNLQVTKVYLNSKGNRTLKSIWKYN